MVKDANNNVYRIKISQKANTRTNLSVFQMSGGSISTSNTNNLAAIIPHSSLSSFEINTNNVMVES